MRSILATLVALISFAVTANPLAAALVVSGYTAETAGKYDRFANDDAFIGNAFDWSGVGRTASGRWGVLISPSFVLSSRHHAPAEGENIRFYLSNDPAGGYDERSIGPSVPLASGGLMTSSDLILTRLHTATENVASYAIRNPATNLLGQELYVWGQANNKDPYLNTRLGRNEVMQVLPGFSSGRLSGKGDVIVYDFDTTLTGLGPDEALLATNDSGAPSFIVGSDGLELVGIHWFTYEANPPVGFPGSGDTLVTSFIDEINSAMAASGSFERVRVSAVPEPGMLGLAMAGLSVVFVRRRKQAA